MHARSRFAYVQARLQARYGQLPEAPVWRRLQGISSLSHFLQLARTTSLRPWLLNISAHGESHSFEKSLRQQLHHHIEEVARWLPEPWRPALRWCAVLIDLPALQHLLSGQPAPAWLLEDNRLKPYAHELLPLRLQALRTSPYAPLLDDDEGLAAAWSRHWHSLWPEVATPADAAALDRLQRTVAGYFDALAAPDAGDSQRARDWLEPRLRHGFRQQAQHPAAAFYYLALAALQLERLRGLLTRLVLFAPRLEQAS